jgi:ubiquinone biosynthesis protein COQ4
MKPNSSQLQIPQQSPQHRPRIRPLIALRAFARTARDPEDTENGARFVLALQGSVSERVFQRFCADPDGARLLDSQPSLLATLSDRDRLAQLPPGSLGREYLDFMTRENLSAQGLAEIVSRVEDELVSADSDRRYVHDRIRDMHDLWHVTTGYSRDLLGELALIAVSYQQLRTRAFGLILPLAYTVNEWKAPGARALLRGAWQRGKAAHWLPIQDWEGLLDRPLDEVRQRLRLGPPPQYTRYFRNPNGFGLVAETPETATRAA